MARSHTPQRLLGGPSRISSHAEHELKLAIDDDFRLLRLPGMPLPRRLLLSTYYDTEFYDLSNARITLRHRIERGKQSWQLKLPPGDDRQEVGMADTQTDLRSALRELLILHLGQRKLGPVVALPVWRSGILVCHGLVSVAQFLKYSTSVRAGFLAGRMVERQRHRRNLLRQDMKPRFKMLLKRGKKVWG
ncbi:hypothetical protein COMA1_11499 [Candidatus Nitrospira nitrosa]|uniref:CYTH domain-containing protein n=1 Tax=Candidatus Nitrospira nitrosa TaxID=1742972 RepID=A0A0S4L8Q3_9BACT|nr:hypothetical protein [Candidatus Nitrospira nitrosa]CUS34067.1 hypothetical protein COMA1_11499 [Candidatus Nitrospira nitrosa]